VGFRSLKEFLDTTIAVGRLIFPVFGALAEFERDIIRERTITGLEAARVRGRHDGRPRALEDDKAQLARRLKAEGDHSVSEICPMLGVGRSTLYRYLKERGNGPRAAGKRPCRHARLGNSKQVTEAVEGKGKGLTLGFEGHLDAVGPGDGDGAVAHATEDKTGCVDETFLPTRSWTSFLARPSSSIATTQPRFAATAMQADSPLPSTALSFAKISSSTGSVTWISSMSPAAIASANSAAWSG
jgi:transposase-like protein